MKVFISSTYKDLINYRTAAIRAVEGTNYQASKMEVFGARPDEPLDACLKEVGESDLFIGIYALRYGFIPENEDISITEMEYLHAKKLGKPIYCFILDEENQPWLKKWIESEPGESKLKELKRLLQKDHVCDYFTTPDDLRAKVSNALSYQIAKIQKPNSSVPIHKSIKATGSTLPTQPYFFGRDKELATIADAIASESRTWGALIDGPGGIGKTALAIRAAHLAPTTLFERKIFITAKIRELTPEGQKTLVDFSRDNYFSMLNELAIELGEEGIPRLLPNERANPLRMAMIGKKILIVFDNLETLSEDERSRLFQFLTRLPEGNKAIVTSRRRADVDARIIRLDRLSAEESLQLIDELAKNNNRLAREDKKARQDLYEITNGNPLLIKWVCGQLGREGSAMHTITETCKFIEDAPEDNDPLEYIFGDLLETFTDSETSVLASLTHFTQPAKLRWIVSLTNLAEKVAETALEDLTDRSILIANNEVREFYLPTLAAKFIRNNRPNIVSQTAERLADRTYALIIQYGGYDNYQGFKVLEDEWLSISSAFPYFLRYPNHLLQNICDSLGYFLNFSGRWDDWLWLNNEAEARSVSVGEIYDAGIRAYQSGWIYYSLEQPSKLRECTIRAEQHLEKAGIREKAFVIRLKGLFCRLIKDYEKATDFFDEALGVWVSINQESDDVVLALNDLANVEFASDDFESAKRNYNNALRIAKKINFVEGIANITGNLANLAISQNDWENAISLAYESLEIARKIGRQEIIAASNFYLAKIYLGLKQPEEGINFARNAVQIFSKIHHKDLEKAISVLSDCEKSMNH